MEGGIHAWEGLTAAGAPDAGMAYFAEAKSVQELIALAWLLEEGSRKFYGAISELPADAEAVSLFGDLAAAEEHHKAALLSLYKNLSGGEPGPSFPSGLIGGEGGDNRMEGGMDVDEALAWAQGKAVTDLLELAIALETNSYDLYLTMDRVVDDAPSKTVFAALSKEEKGHLARLADLLEKKF